MKPDKAALRTRMKAVRAQIQTREEKSARICAHIAALPEFERARCVFCYNAFGSEVRLDALMDLALEMGKRVLLPVVKGEDMIAVPACAREQMRPGPFGIQEPSGAAADPESIDLVLCPGLAFDAQGGRLGYGKGYYDRYLLKVHAFLAGICYTDCIVDSVPAGAWDVRMHALVCEAGIKRIGGIE